MLTGIGLGVAVGLVLGWQVHRAYLRYLFKTMVRIRRQLRGGK